MRCLVVGLAVGVVGCAGGVGQDASDSELNRELARSVAALGAAVVAEDAAAFEAMLAPGLLASVPSESVARAAYLKDSLRVQKAGWLNSLGADASNPRIAEIGTGTDGEYSIRLQLKDGRDEKKIWFRIVDGKALFLGPHPEKSDVASRTVAAAMEVWNWRWQNNTPFVPNSGSFYAYSCPLVGTYPHSAYSNIWKAVGCEPGRVGSCTAAIVSTYGGVNDCKNSCWYQWIGADVWWQQTAYPQMYCGT